MTKLRLFSASAGLCQRPDCLKPIFEEIGGKIIHIAELAHVFSASDVGPRTSGNLTPDERGLFENLILLCPTCHTIIDKAPDEFSDAIVLQWKYSHAQRIDTAFGCRRFDSRVEVSEFLTKLFRQNQKIFERYGPKHPDHLNPETELASLWKEKIRSKILPNNQLLLRAIDANADHLNNSELDTVEDFRCHVDDFAEKHLEKWVSGGTSFPSKAPFLFGESNGK